MRYRDRRDAGRRLADELADLRTSNPVVAGMARGGVPVAFEVARRLGAPLDVLVVRKLGAPMQPELGMGAIAEGGAVHVDRRLVERLGVRPDELEAIVRAQMQELDRRVALYRQGRDAIDVRGRTVIVVDDGLATGSTSRAAIASLRRRGAERVVLAVPVAAAPSVDALAQDADRVVCPYVPMRFMAVGEWYDDFRQTSDEEVLALTGRTRREVTVPPGLPGTLTIPGEPVGVIAFAHGSGSGRHSPRNRSVAAALQARGLGTLLFDLLSEQEASDRRLVFDIPLLGERLSAAVGWLRPEVELPVGLFGASTGAAAALVAAARDGVGAVVSRGGRPDLAGEALADVQAPTLLIVGGRDEPVIDMNRQAQRRLRCENRLVIVPGATHLFEEPGTLEQVADLAGAWFTEHLGHVAHRP